VNTPKRERRRVLEFVSGVPGVRDVDVAKLRIAPEQVSSIYCRYDVPPHSVVAGDYADQPVVEWLLQLMEETGIGVECYVWFALPEGRLDYFTPGDSWIRLTLADGRKSLVEFWKALPSHNLLVVDAAQEWVLGISEEEYEYLGHLMTVDELLERHQS
jgi:hypothetical protein